MNIEVTILNSADEPWEGKRSPEGDPVLTGANWTEIAKALAGFSFTERGATDARAVLDRYIERWRFAVGGAGLNLPADLEGRCRAFFIALKYRRLVSIEMEDN